VRKRKREWYTGHRAPKTVPEGYDLGLPPAQLDHVAETMGALVVGELGRTDLQVPTAKIEQWGRATRRGWDRDLLCAELRATGWLITRTAQTPAGAVVTPPQDSAEAGDLDAAGLAHRAGVSPSTARRWMRQGELPAREVTWGDRTLWTARSADVDTFLSARGHLRLRDPSIHAQRGDQVVDFSGGYLVDVDLHHDRVQRHVDTPAGRQQRGEEGPGAQLGDLHHQVPGRGRDGLLGGAVALGRPFWCALIGVGADMGGGLGIAESMSRITLPPLAVRSTSVSSSRADWFRVIV
jgi:hypothetical protein